MRCLVVLACVCAVAYARAQSSVDSSALKTNAEITQEEPVEELNTSDLKINSISNQGSEADDANTNNNENETNVSNNGEVLDVAPTILAPSVPIPKPDETNYSAKNEDLDVAPTNLAPSVPISKPDETNYSANNEDLDVAPTNLAPSVPISKPDETNYSAKDEDLDVAPTNLAPSVIISKPDETNYSANNEDLDVAPTNLAPSVPISKPDETNYSAKDEDLDVAPTNLAPSVIISKPDETNYSAKDEDLDVAPTNLAPSVIISKPDETNYSAKDEDLDVAPTNLAPIIVADIDESDNSVNDEDLEVAPTNLAPSISSERQGRYKALPNQESAPRSGGKFICKEKNERYSVPGSCDSYIECLNGTAEEKQCPDGLRYNPNVLFNVYPCQYPIDVPCLGRSALQPAQPTADCPHQFGYFKTGDSRNCSGFRNCVNGVGYEFTCPDGLAFSSDTYRCEWPDQVSDCDAEAFLGFRCPEVPATKELGPPAGFRFYRSPSDCQVYFLCIDGKPRRLGCGGYSAFDELTETCVNAEEVSVCPQELKTRAAQAKEKEERRRRLLEENPLKQSRYISRELPTNVPTYSEPEPEQNLDEENGVESVTPTQLGPELEE